MTRLRTSAPSISVITVTKNSQATIQQTLESVGQQSYSNCDHIVIDGASIDGTISLTEACARQGLRLQSEPDEGIADAMNKGINLANAEWLLFINADDYLSSQDSLSAAAAYLTDEFDVVGFPVQFGDPNKFLVTKNPRGANWYMHLKTGLLHQGTFIRKELFESIGYFDTNFQVTMDYEFFLRAYKQGARFSTHDAPLLTVMRDSGVSSRKDWPSLSVRLNEERKAQLKHATGFWKAIHPFYWLLYPAYRRFRIHFQGWFVTRFF